MDIQAAESQINGTTFIAQPEGRPRWMVVESYAWNELQEDLNKYGTIEWNGDGVLTFKPGFSDYPLTMNVLQNIADFMKAVVRKQTPVAEVTR